MNIKHNFKFRIIIEVVVALMIVWISDINHTIANSIWLTKNKVYDSDETVSNNILFKNINNIDLNSLTL